MVGGGEASTISSFKTRYHKRRTRTSSAETIITLPGTVFTKKENANEIFTEHRLLDPRN